MEQCISKIEEIIGYNFDNKQLLIEALTHSSYINEHKGESSYDKLEFFGDSILSFIVAEQLYLAKAENEGEMTVKRSKIVSRKPLSETVEKMGLYKYIRFGNGAIKNEFTSEKTRSDIFESILAAIYLDSKSMDEARAFVKRHLSVFFKQAFLDFRSKLQEYAQAKKISLEYPPARQIGSPSHPFFRAEAIFAGNVVCEGEGGSIKEARQNAAKQVLERLGLI